MERYSLIVVSDETSPIRRFDVRKASVRRALQAAAALAVVVLLGLVDYARVRYEHPELARLRAENAEQKATIDSFDEKVAGVNSALQRIEEFERKVRIIANLPGAAAVGGEDLTELAPAATGGGVGQELMLPAGVPIDVEKLNSEKQEDRLDVPLSSLSPAKAHRLGLSTPGALYVHGLESLASSMGGHQPMRDPR